MGVYDTVLVPCPICGTEAEFQSKSGPCRLTVYRLWEAPADVLANVNRHAPQTCEKCGAVFDVWVQKPLAISRLVPRPTDDHQQAEIQVPEGHDG